MPKVATISWQKPPKRIRGVEKEMGLKIPVIKSIAWQKKKKKKAQAAHCATDCFSHRLRADFLLAK